MRKQRRPGATRRTGKPRSRPPARTPATTVLEQFRDVYKRAAAERKFFAANTRRARQAAGLTQRDLAILTGLTQSWVSALEKGNANLRLDTMAAVAAAVKVPLHELLKPPQK
jgi:DNA-binding XRE family transcriptional regulator